MLSLVVVDRSAESRHRLVGELHRLLGADLPDLAFVPRIGVTPRAIHEMKFQAAPDICLIGREIVEGSAREIVELRQVMPAAVILAEVGSRTPGLALIERLARYGVDDVLPADFSAEQIFQKLVLHTRRHGTKKRGQLVVVGAGKGGLGVTSVAVATADIAARSGKKTLLIDCDGETQDASRFLHVRPFGNETSFLNETLQAIFDQQKPVAPEFVEQSLVAEDTSSFPFRIMPPTGEGELAFDPHAAYSRVLVSLLEVLDGMFDVTVVDLGSARGALLDVFHRSADTAIVVASADPAALHPTVERARRMQASLGATARLMVVENRTGPGGLPNGFALQEVLRSIGRHREGVRGVSIPYCNHGAMWPGSGETLYRFGRGGIRRAIELLWKEIVATEGEVVSCELGRYSAMRRIVRAVRRRCIFARPESPTTGKPQSLPTPLLGGESGRESQRQLPLLNPETALDPRALISGFREHLESVS